MTLVNVADAKTQLSRLLAAAERGEDVVIARGGVPVARLVPVAAGRRFGALAGLLDVGDEAAEPLDAEEAALWQ